MQEILAVWLLPIDIVVGVWLGWIVGRHLLNQARDSTERGPEYRRRVAGPLSIRQITKLRNTARNIAKIGILFFPGSIGYLLYRVSASQEFALVEGAFYLFVILFAVVFWAAALFSIGFVVKGSLVCPHCAHKIPPSTRWQCPYCGKVSGWSNGIAEPCIHCKQKPWGFICTACGKPMYFTKDERRQKPELCARPLERVEEGVVEEVGTELVEVLEPVSEEPAGEMARYADHVIDVMIDVVDGEKRIHKHLEKQRHTMSPDEFKRYSDDMKAIFRRAVRKRHRTFR